MDNTQIVNSTETESNKKFNLKNPELIKRSFYLYVVCALVNIFFFTLAAMDSIRQGPKDDLGLMGNVLFIVVTILPIALYGLFVTVASRKLVSKNYFSISLLIHLLMITLIVPINVIGASSWFLAHLFISYPVSLVQIFFIPVIALVFLRLLYLIFRFKFKLSQQ